MDQILLDIQTKIIRATLLTNMAVLKNHLPELFDFYKDYRPGSTKITFDHDDNLNLVSDGSLVYDGDPKELSGKQVEKYSQIPKYFIYQMAFPTEAIVFDHERLLKHLCDKREEETNNCVDDAWEEEQLDFFCMIGSGLGYQIEELFKRKKIRSFFLFEPDPDVFYATLQTINLQPFVESCMALGGAFTVHLGGEETTFVNEVSNLFKRHGQFNVCRMFLYRHYFSDKNDEAFKLYHEIAYRYSSGWGFMEDEIISLTHSISNLSKGSKLLSNKDKTDLQLTDISVVIASNGPSIDGVMSFIKENQGNCIVFSCGTALRALLKNGITPDFHIEMERAASLISYLDTIEDQKALKSINVIALNTVYTELLSKFKSAYLMLKPNDAGGSLVKSLDKENIFPYVPYCNPTVSNTALAAAINLGFKKIYLMGVDLGFKDTEQHHSKDSIYYDKNWDKREKVHQLYKTSKKVEGNFEEEVLTTNTFDSSKGILEMMISKYPGVKVYNCSDGVKILLTKPKRVEELDFTKIQNKSELLETLLDKKFDSAGLTKEKLHDAIESKISSVQSLMDELLGLVAIKKYSRTELVTAFTRQYAKLNSVYETEGSSVPYTTLKGSFIYFQTGIITNSYYYKDESARSDFIEYGLTLMNEHFSKLMEELKVGYKQAAKI